MGETIEVTKKNKNSITKIFPLESEGLLNLRLNSRSVKTKKVTIPQQTPIIIDKIIFIGLSEIK